MRASFFGFAALLLLACSGSSSNDVLGPSPSSSSSSGGASASGGTSTDSNDTTPPDSTDDPPNTTTPPKDDDDPPTKPPATPPPTTSPPATAADCDAFAATFCTKASACDHLIEKLLGTNCADRVGNICKARLSAPGIGLTTAALTACGNAYATTASCEDAFGSKQLAGCTFNGSLALNAECAFGDQCASGYCTGSADNSCGTCQPMPAVASPTYVGLGEACDSTGQGGPQCNSNFGLWCSMSTKKCTEIALAGIGQPCGFVGGDFVMCGPGGACGYGSSATGTCVAERAAGTACSMASGYEECAFGTSCIGGKCAYPTAAAICK